MATAVRQQDIVGWGADLEKSKRPAARKEGKGLKTGAHWTEPEAQPIKIKVHHSIERPAITHVFGTSAPPSGVSGKIRDVAFRYSEGQLSHWMLLLFADRVNVVEGIASDLRRGHIPNLYKEMGLAAEFKYNREATMRKLAIAGGALGALTLALVVRRRLAR